MFNTLLNKTNHSLTYLSSYVISRNLCSAQYPIAMRSLLFVPGRKELLEKAINREWKPDVLLPDMEDSVPNGDEKIVARKTIQDMLPRLCEVFALNTRIIPRVNSLDSGLVEEDITAVVGPHIYGISVGKVGSAQDIKQLDSIISRIEAHNGEVDIGSTRLIPWLETSDATINAAEICRASSRIVGVAFGGDDFLTDMEIVRSSSSDDDLLSPILTHARAKISIAARSASIQAFETPYVNFKSSEGLKKAATNAKLLGYQGMFAIHPSQVDIINEVFSPSKEEIEYATRVVSLYEQAQAQGKGSTSIDGKMIDTPVVKRAYTVLQRAQSICCNDT